MAPAWNRAPAPCAMLFAVQLATVQAATALSLKVRLIQPRFELHWKSQHGHTHALALISFSCRSLRKRPMAMCSGLLLVRSAQAHGNISASNILLTRAGARGVCGRLGLGRLRAKACTLQPCALPAVHLLRDRAGPTEWRRSLCMPKLCHSVPSSAWHRLHPLLRVLLLSKLEALSEAVGRWRLGLHWFLVWKGTYNAAWRRSAMA